MSTESNKYRYNRAKRGKTSITEQKVNVIRSDNVDMIRKICREGRKKRWKVE